MKKGLLLLVLSILIVLPASVFAGVVAGKVTIAKTGDALPNAAVFLVGEDVGTYTKKNGSFIIQNVMPGNYEVAVSFVGYSKRSVFVDVIGNETTVVNFAIEVEAIKLGGISVNETRATKRESPIAFGNVTRGEVKNKYTTDDTPQLLEGVPGVFSTTAGLGEGELKMRGFDADKVQILINGIPVNDPESQQVYWSNWTGLSSNIKSVQVQRGAGSSLYGSGAFGGTVNIETIGAGADPGKQWTFRTSFGAYTVENEVADGKGGFVDYNPSNYNMLLRYNSGNLYDGKFNYSAAIERKVGGSYAIGTGYDGWSFGSELQNIWGNHKVNTSLIIAPQKHNQARTTTDMELVDALGRNYNRNNHPYQENYYNKPQLSVRDEWRISETSLLMTNVFFTRGDGGGKYLRNDVFDVTNGQNTYKSTSDYYDDKYFARHAVHIYEETGIMLQGFSIDDSLGYMWNGEEFAYGYGYNIINNDYNHSWMNDSANNHKQFGFNTYYDHRFSDMFKLVVGGEWRRWKALHRAQSRNYRYNYGVYDRVQDRYSYYGTVENASGFARIQIKPFAGVTFVADGQYAFYKSRVDEEPIEIFDFQKGTFTGECYYATKNILNDDGSLKFTDGDYKKSFDFFSPKFGINFNVTDYLNVLANYSIAYKEPRVGDWYSRSGGPNDPQIYEDSEGNEVYTGELDPEKTINTEIGIGYDGIWFDIETNYYWTTYEDKIEGVVQQSGDYVTINAGEAKHEGLEFSANALVGDLDIGFSGSMGKYRWQKMNVDEIFGEDAEDVVGKVVPYSPEKMASFYAGYTFGDLPMDGYVRIGFSGNWWDEYYGSYTNEYQKDDGDPFNWTLEVDDEGEPIMSDAKLPYYFALNSDIGYHFKIAGKDASLRLDLKNINNRKDNYTRAYSTKDYNRNDDLSGKYYMYVLPAPLFSAFLTAEVSF